MNLLIWVTYRHNNSDMHPQKVKAIEEWSSELIGLTSNLSLQKSN